MADEGEQPKVLQVDKPRIPARISFGGKIDVINAGSPDAFIEVKDGVEALSSPIAIYAARALLAKLSNVDGVEATYLQHSIRNYLESFYELLVGIGKVKNHEGWLHEEKFDRAKGMTAEAFAAIMFDRLNIPYRFSSMNDDRHGNDIFVLDPSKNDWIPVDLTASRHTDEVARKLTNHQNRAVLALPMGEMRGFMDKKSQKEIAPLALNIERMVGVVLKENWKGVIPDTSAPLSIELLNDALKSMGKEDGSYRPAMKNYANTVVSFNRALMAHISRTAITEEEKKLRQPPIIVGRKLTAPSQRLLGSMQAYMRPKKESN